MLKEFLTNNNVKDQMMKKIYKLIQLNKQMTKNDLLLKTGIKHTTLNRMIDGLMERQLIKESGQGTSSGGRPPTLYQIEEKANYIIGIEISRTETKVVLLDLFFKIVKKESFQMTMKDEPSIVFSKIKRMINHFLANLNIAVDRLLGIGVGTVGPMDRQKGIIYNPEAFLAPNWEHVKIRELLKQNFPIRITIDNGANTAAIAESTQRNFLYNNILYCINGYGIRCGVISNGNLIHSKQGDASAFGHIIIHEDGKECICGQKGCLTAYASYGAILKEFNELTRDSSNLEIFIRKLNEDDPKVKQIAEKAAHYYGIGIANMVNILNPELIVLHGSLIYESSFYYNAVIKSAISHTYKKDKETIKFSKGLLGEDGIAVGAAIQIFQSYFEGIELEFPKEG